jgi:hypothetical protein
VLRWTEKDGIENGGPVVFLYNFNSPNSLLKDVTQILNKKYGISELGTYNLIQNGATTSIETTITRERFMSPERAMEL